MTPHACTYTTDKHCAAFRRGVLVVVRRSDKHSFTMTNAETNFFRRRVLAYEFDNEDRDSPIDDALEIHKKRFARDKYVVPSRCGQYITFHQRPLGEKP